MAQLSWQKSAGGSDMLPRARIRWWGERPPYLRLCRLLPALVSPLFLLPLPLLPILLPLIVALGSCMLILLCSPSRPGIIRWSWSALAARSLP